MSGMALEEAKDGSDIFGAHPLLKVEQRDSTTIVFLDEADAELRIDGLAETQARTFIEALDGQTSIADAATKAGIPLAAGREIAGEMVAEGLASAPRATDSTFTPERFARMCRSLYGPLKSELFSEPLWESLNTGTAPQSVFIGWLIENYHFIEGVNDRLALVAGSSRHPKVKPLFIKHYLEEWNHYQFFVKALGIVGISYDDLRKTRPLAATNAILNHMRYCARADEVAYAVCSGFLESTGEDRLKSIEFFARLEANFCQKTPGAVKPLVDHLKLDEAYQHNSVVENVCFALGENISAARAQRAIAGLLLLVDTMKMWSREIARWYAGPFVRLVGRDWPRSLATGRGPSLVLRPDAKVTFDDEGVSVESLDNDYRFESAYAPAFRRVQCAVDGTEAEAELPPNLVRYLSEEGLVVDAGPSLKGGSAKEFIEHYWSLCEFWSTAFRRSEFWERLHSGKAPIELVLGWGIEFFKYVQGANEYMALAVASCREDAEARAWLAKLFEEESDHSEIFLKGLERCGLDRQAVLDAPELPSTRALLNWLGESATGSSLRFAAVFGIMRAGVRSSNPDEAKEYFGSLAQLYPQAEPLFRAILSHALIDCDLRHDELVLERMLLKRGAVHPPEAIDILETARGCADQFALFFEGIGTYYGADRPELPRRDRARRWMHWR